MEGPTESELERIERDRVIAEMADGRWGSILGRLPASGGARAGRPVDAEMITGFARRADDTVVNAALITSEIKGTAPDLESAERHLRELFQEALGYLWMAETMGVSGNDLEPYASIADWVDAHGLADPSARLLCATKLMPEAQPDPQFAATLAGAYGDLRAADPDGAEVRIDRLRDEAMGAIAQVIEQDSMSPGLS